MQITVQIRRVPEISMIYSYDLKDICGGFSFLRYNAYNDDHDNGVHGLWYLYNSEPPYKRWCHTICRKIWVREPRGDSMLNRLSLKCKGFSSWNMKGRFRHIFHRFSQLINPVTKFISGTCWPHRKCGLSGWLNVSVSLGTWTIQALPLCSRDEWQSTVAPSYWKPLKRIHIST